MASHAAHAMQRDWVQVGKAKTCFSVLFTHVSKKYKKRHSTQNAFLQFVILYPLDEYCYMGSQQ